MQVRFLLAAHNQLMMFNSEFFPFVFEGYSFDDNSVRFENAIFIANLGPFKAGEEYSNLSFNILDGVLSWYGDTEENEDEKKEVELKLQY
jgi:hypothetical protein